MSDKVLWVVVAVFAWSRARYLTAVFIDDNEPMDPAPESLYLADIFFTELSPGLAQIFFVGDGLSGEGTGTTQTFNVPDGATRLYLGFQDRCSTSPNVPGWFGDNTGNVTGTVTFNVSTGVDHRTSVARVLGQNFPNPFGSTTSISFVPSGTYELSVYDVRGRLVRVLQQGRNGGDVMNVTWDGRDARGTLVKSGVYYYRLKSVETTETRKMVLLR